MTDVLVAGGGPAGRALARACARRGLATTLVDPSPHRPWQATYGLWSDEVPGLPATAIAAAPARTVAYGTREHHLDRDYLVLANDGLRNWLTAPEVTILTGRVITADHGPHGSTVLLADGRRLTAAVVVDATGAARTLSGGRPRGPRAEQTAYGLVIPAESAERLIPDAADTAVFMDWRNDPELGRQALSAGWGGAGQGAVADADAAASPLGAYAQDRPEVVERGGAPAAQPEVERPTDPSGGTDRPGPPTRADPPDATGGHDVAPTRPGTARLLPDLSGGDRHATMPDQPGMTGHAPSSDRTHGGHRTTPPDSADSPETAHHRTTPPNRFRGTDHATPADPIDDHGVVADPPGTTHHKGTSPAATHHPTTPGHPNPPDLTHHDVVSDTPPPVNRATGPRGTSAGAGPRHGALPGPDAAFCYFLPRGDGSVLVEETSLARRPGVPAGELAARLRARLAACGVPAEGRAERVRIVLDLPMSGRGRVVPFGVAGGFVHPATGYSLATALRLAPVVAGAIAGAFDAGPAAAARAAHRALWTVEARAVHVLRRHGLRALLGMSPDQLAGFFELFFSLPPAMQRAFTSGRDDLPGTAGAMGRVFRTASPRLRWHLLG
ncbi:lycopene cyclase-like protein [Amycolatopsis sulphurea]|uniref:Lycopene cyclase-like protein n=1 Tax=Amycolatopsis sulphurea TaxID=76022 RepID=A0A2A9FZ11_9PSEU|nr:lycopene cyclase family protein [Amycolatopsis sulphurea]PFG56707.1 lycopene cyclase-like protein [Amycolatopsis sulphurea]